jgi:glyoxylase I family protein
MPNKNTILGGGGFHHVAIKVKDFDATVAFYTALGFTEKVAWGEGDGRACFLDTGDGNYIEVFAGGPPRDQRHPWGEGSAIVHFSIRVKNCEAATRLAEKHGAKVTMETKPITIQGNRGQKIPIKISFVQAPGGEVLEFYENDPKDL